MARKANAPAVIDHADVEPSLATAITENVQQFSEHSSDILKKFGGGDVVFILSEYEEEVRITMERGARAMIDVGRRLIVIKEHVAHGEWMDSLDRMGVAPRTAQKMMQAAFKFLSSAGSKNLLDHMGNKSKALELLVLDEGDLEALGAGGTVAGLTLDKIDCMSSTELRKALRDARESQEDQQRIIADKNKKIDDQSKQISRIKKQPADTRSSDLRTEVAALTNTIDHDLRVNFYNALAAVRDHDSEQEIAYQDFITAQIEQAEAALALVRRDLVLGVEWE